MGRGPILGSLYEGPHYFGSILGAPDFWNLHLRLVDYMARCILVDVRQPSGVSVNFGLWAVFRMDLGFCSVIMASARVLV